MSQQQPANVEEWGGFSSGDELTQPLNPQSAVIDMSTIDETSPSSSFEDIGDSHKRQTTSNEEDGSKFPDGGFGGDIRKAVADQMWKSGQQQAQQVLSVYANIDILRPYFDVEPKTIVMRLCRSFVPIHSISIPQKIPGELYGPLMIVFTLVAILLMNMKLSNTSLQQGTYIGTSLGLCFGYWFGVSGFMYFLSYLCNTYISIVQCLSLLGYGLVAHCVILLVGNITHYTHSVFYFMWIVFAGAATARIVTILLSRTVGKSQRQRLVLCGTLAALHMLFLLYLHFVYHRVMTGSIWQSLEVEEFPGNIGMTKNVETQDNHKEEAPDYIKDE